MMDKSVQSKSGATDIWYFPQKIETRTPKTIDSAADRRTALLPLFEHKSSVEDIKQLYKKVCGRNPAAKSRYDITAEFCDFLVFENVEKFNAWFFSFPEAAQKILWKIIFWGAAPEEVFVKALKVTSITDTKKGYDYSYFSSGYERNDYRIIDELHLDFIVVKNNLDKKILSLHPVVCYLLRPWLVPPPEGSLENCATDAAGALWNNAHTLYDSVPLLCDALSTLLKTADKYKILRGIPKRECDKLRESCGFVDWDRDAPRAIDLLSRFIFCMTEFHVVRHENSHAYIKDLVKKFFTSYVGPPKKGIFWDGENLEANVLLDHLARKSTGTNYLGWDDATPPSRLTFGQLLLEIAHDGRIFDADKLILYAFFRYLRFTISRGGSYESELKLTADSITLEGIKYEREGEYSWERKDFHPTGELRLELLIRPLIKAYFYLFASLGIVEITQKPAPMRKISKGVEKPLTIYDGLATVRITDFGLWCLDLSKNKPAVPERKYEAIADKELFLVTVRGNSLERRVFLDKIGEKLGEERWRISPASFISHCSDKADMEEQIQRFHKLIDDKPARHWEDFFAKLRGRYDIFTDAALDAVVYSLPDDNALCEELLRDPNLKGVALRAEGRLLVVPEKNKQKFAALLRDHGIGG
jgi:hypothetical protein